MPNTAVKLLSADGSGGLVPVRVGRCHACSLKCFSAIAQSVERMTVNHDVTGSSPVCGVNGAIAQLAEHVTEAHGVGSSILSPGTILKRPLHLKRPFLFSGTRQSPYHR